MPEKVVWAMLCSFKQRVHFPIFACRCGMKSCSKPLRLDLLFQTARTSPQNETFGENIQTVLKNMQDINIYIYIYADPGTIEDIPGFPVKTGTSWPPGAAMHLNHLHIAHEPHTTFYRLLIDSMQSFTTFGADLTIILVSIQE